eukprot:4907379-Amphidinium_carterae.1
MFRVQIASGVYASKFAPLWSLRHAFVALPSVRSYIPSRSADVLWKLDRNGATLFYFCVCAVATSDGSLLDGCMIEQDVTKPMDGRGTLRVQLAHVSGQPHRPLAWHVWLRQGCVMTIDL